MRISDWSSDVCSSDLAQGRNRRVDVGTVNDKLFLNNSSIGLYATIVLDREAQQRRLGRGKWQALCRATLAALRDPDAIDRQSGVEGKSGYVRGDLGGRRNI